MDELSLDRFELTEPSTKAEWASYFDLRWRVLREPWHQPRGSERDPSDSSSYHLMLRDPGGSVFAVGRLHLNSAKEAQVRYMAVDHGYRGKGLGSRILKGLEAHSRAMSAGEIVLNAREDSVAFYIRHGYSAEGLAETLFGEVRHIRMRKILLRTWAIT